MDLAHERVDIDHEPLRSGPRAGAPGAPQRLAEHAIELTHMPEGKAAQERPERRGRQHAVAEHAACLARAQHVAVVDRVRAEQHRVHEREHLRARAGGARALPEPYRFVDDALQPEAHSERRGEQQTRVSHHPRVVKTRFDPVQPRSTPGSTIRHHPGDLLSAGPAAAATARLACSGGHSGDHLGRPTQLKTVDRGLAWIHRVVVVWGVRDVRCGGQNDLPSRQDGLLVAAAGPALGRSP